ncbi:RsmE family RNA methyltransferase, partial [bacterium]|nr:RsmE family RNA methyltransferase [bacterium]
MRTARFFVPEEWIALSAEAFSIPAGPLHKQIVQVLRMKSDDHLSLLPNNGTEIECRITDITRSAVTGVITGSRIIPPLKPEVTVCAAITKKDTFEWMLQKCTELGVAHVIPLHTDRTIKKTPGVNKRWNEIVKEASEQSGRATIPTIEEPITFAKAMGKTASMARIIFHEEGEESKLPPLQKTMPLALFIGPEGGFTPQEIAFAKELARAVLPVSMYTQFYWTLNARALMNFLSLRNHPSAQLDIRQYAAEVEKSFQQVMPVTHECWVKNGRIAP